MTEFEFKDEDDHKLKLGQMTFEVERELHISGNPNYEEETGLPFKQFYNDIKKFT